jgi:hypothetical protein
MSYCSAGQKGFPALLAQIPAPHLPAGTLFPFAGEGTDEGKSLHRSRNI